MTDMRSAFNDIVRTELATAGPGTCECRCNKSPNPHGAGPCQRRATHYVALHRWGWCDEDDPADVTLDADGNVTAVMCATCANESWLAAAANIRKLLMAIPPGERPHCPTCGRPTHLTSDIIEKRVI